MHYICKANQLFTHNTHQSTGLTSCLHTTSCLHAEWHAHYQQLAYLSVNKYIHLEQITNTCIVFHTHQHFCCLFYLLSK